jgi:fumarate hydratase class II
MSRTEHDSLGPVEVPDGALYGAQTQRAIENFHLSGRPMPPRFIRALARIKQAAALANGELGVIDNHVAEAIARAAAAVAGGAHADQFPVEVFQTGSGTSTNMNMNEVLATLASRASGVAVNANDHVNACQSSNDVIPATIHLSAALALVEELVPALAHLSGTLAARGRELANVVKTGRTHLMDAMPLTFGQELSGWQAQVDAVHARLRPVLASLERLPLGGTAVGTGVNAHPDFAAHATARLAAITGLHVGRSANPFAAMAGQDTVVALSGELKSLAVTLMKIANDLRWMNSGPLAGLGEIELPALQPGSSIMPGKVNPVIPEAVAMVAARVIGLDATITIAAQSGNFQLNVMLPLIADAALEAIGLLARACRALADLALAGFTIREDRIAEALGRNPILVTALNPLIGYARAAEIAKRAYAERRSIVDVAAEMTDLPREELEALLDPGRLVKSGNLQSR